VSIWSRRNWAGERWPWPDAFGNAVDEEVDDLVLAEVARGEVLIVGPELLAEFGRSVRNSVYRPPARFRL
jgi:hypothetical protein